MKKIYTLLTSAILFLSAMVFAQTYNYDFNFNPPAAQCAPATYNFNGSTNDPNAFQFVWNFGDGSPTYTVTAPTYTASHTYTTSGWMNAYAYVYDNVGAFLGTANSTSGNLYVNGLLGISVSDTICPADVINLCLNYEGQANNTSVNWNFGDGNFDNGNNHYCSNSHSYAAGNYTVSVSMNGQCGNQSASKPLVVNNNVYPNVSWWTSGPNTVCPNSPVNFNTNQYVTYSWNFGDGSPLSTQQYPTHSYTATGTYSVTLTATNNCGHSSSNTYPVTVSSSAPFPNNLGIYSSNGFTVCPSQQINLYVQDNSFPKYKWNYGDGSPIDSISGSNTSHAYTVLGTKTVTCTVHNTCGNDSVLVNTVNVVNYSPFPNYINLQVNSSPACPNTNIGFNAPCCYNSYQWDFGDGSPVTTNGNGYMNHTYGNTLTTYTASVKITSPCGNDTTLYNTVTISNSVHFPSGMSLANQSPACPNSYVQLYVNGNGNFPTYKWNFGDGSPTQTNSNSGNSHLYSAVGNYTASVDITNNCGLDTVMYTIVNINNNVGFPANNFGLNVHENPACPNSPVDFDVPMGYVSYKWTFGDGSPSLTTTNYYYTHTYTAAATYTASVMITNACGKDTTVSALVNIQNNAGFQYLSYYTYPNNTACPNESVSFNTSYNYSRYIWNFGDGSPKDTTYNAYTSHSYTAVGNYTTSVTIRNACGQDTVLYQAFNVSSTNQIPNGIQIQVNNSPACPNSSISMNTQSGFAYYTWTFGDGGVDSTSNSYYINHTYTTTGTYTISVKIKNSCGYSSTIYNTVVINNSIGFPKNNFSVYLSPNPVCPGGGVSIGAPSGNQWYVYTYGDGSPKDSVTYSGTNHTYNNVGHYKVSIRVFNFCGKDTTISDSVFVKNNVGFTSNLYMNLESPACPNDMLNMNTSGGYSAYVWNFGDGHTASGSNDANHTYTATGTYTVSVKITNQCGIDTTIYSTEVIDNSGSFPNWLSLDANPTIACPNDLVKFDMQKGYISYFWNFGDGDTITTTSYNVQHGYTSTGIYTASCKVTNGCGKSTTLYKSVTVSSNAPVSQISIMIPTNPACPLDNVLFMVQGGQATYNYIWNFGDGSPLDTTLGLNPLHQYSATGTYTITMVATNGCGNSSSTSAVATITNNANPVLTMPGSGSGSDNRLWGIPGVKDGSSAGCAGDVITYFIVGDYPNNVWSFGDGHTGTATQHMLIATNDGNWPVTFIKHAYAANGTFTVKLTVTDNCNKSLTDSMHVIIGGNQLVNGQLNISPPPYTTCSAVSFVAFGGATYKFDYGDGNSVTTSSPTASHIYASQGNYVTSVLITNGCGNSATYSIPVNVNGAGGPSLSIGSTSNPSCLGNDGSAMVNATGGFPPYTYSWSNGATTTTASGLSAGTYTATVTDNIGCPNFIPVTLNNPAPIVLNSTTTKANCGVANATATVTITSGGTAPYTYNWSTGSTMASVSGLAYGSYSVNVTDVNGCFSSTNISISELNTATVSVNSITDAACNGSSNGVISINVSGGNPPFTYAWSSGATTQNASNLAAGTYSVLVTDNGSCKAVFNATVGQPASIVASTSVVQAPTCSNFDGKVSASGTGGTPPYTYAWTNAGGQTTQTVTGLAAGTRTVTITDSHGCTGKKVFTLSNSNAPVIASTVVNVSCNGKNDGYINLNVTGGNGSYLYTWSMNVDNNIAGDQSNNSNVDSLSPGNYIVTVQDAANCLSLNNFTITQPAVLTTSTSVSGTVCNHSNGSIMALPAGGTSPYHYAWTGGQTVQTAMNLGVGNYTVTVTDNNGCTAKTSANIATVAVPQAICIVSVDSTSTKNQIVWEKTPGMATDTFNIYREISSTYQLIAKVPYTSLSEFTDTTNGVNPNITSYKYEVSTVDSCGNESVLSAYHRTIHLAVSPATPPNSYNLLWNDYIGIPVTQYVIMRDSAFTGWKAVDSVSFGNNSWTDTQQYPANDTISYYIRIDHPGGCQISIKNPSTLATNLNSSKSNVYRVDSSTVTHVKNLDIELMVGIYPNPNSGIFTVDIANGNSMQAAIRVFNMLGEEVQAVTYTNGNNRTTLNLSKQAKGVYYVQISSAHNVVTKKIIIE